MNIESKVIELAAEQVGLRASAVNMDTAFYDIGYDSLDNVELIMMLEMEYDIEIDDPDMETITTVRQAVEHVTKAIAG